MYDDVLKLVREALPLECRFPAPESWDTPLPYLSRIRAVARLFAMEAEVRRLDNKCRAAADSALDALEMAQDVKTQQTMIAHLVGMACEAIAFASLDATVPGLTSAECQEVLARLRGIVASRPSVADAFNAEETLVRVGIKRFIADPARLATAFAGAGPSLTAAQLALVQGSLPQAWELIGPYYDALRGSACLPFRQRQPIAPPDNLYLQNLGHMDRVLFRECRATTVAHLHVLQLAAMAYLRDKGHDPAKLSDLVPEYLPQIPEDPMTGEPLRAVTREAAYSVYSVGPDGVDDGGSRGKRPVFGPDDSGDITVVVGSGTNRTP